MNIHSFPITALALFNSSSIGKDLRTSRNINITNLTFNMDFNIMPKEFKMPTLEYFWMLKAKRKRLREEQESTDVDPVRTHPSSPTLTFSEGMNCSSQSPRLTKRACVDLATGNARILKEEDHIPANTCIPTEASKLDPPAVKSPPARYVDFGAAENASGGFGQEGQDDKDEDMVRRVDRDFRRWNYGRC